MFSILWEWKNVLERVFSMSILEIIVAVILVESVTNILTKSELFEPLRKFLFESESSVLGFIHKILDCPYCTSVWIGLLVVLGLYLYSANALPSLLVWFCIGVVLHRLSNVLHFLIDRLDSV